MAVQSETSSVAYVGNNSTSTPYVVTFKFFQDEHIKVTVTDVDGVETVLELTTDFTVTGAGEDEGGEILTVDAWDNTHTITIKRVMPNTQPYSYTEGQRLPAATLEENFDWIVMLAQQLSGLNGTGQPALLFPFSEPSDSNRTLPSKADRKGTLIYFNATTGELETISVDEFADLVDNETVTISGDNVFEGDNTFSGTTTFDGAVDFNGLVTFGGQVEFTVETLTDAASIAWDASLGNMAQVTLGGNRTLANPTNMKAGTYLLRVTQDGTGGRTLAYGANFKFPGGTVPTLSTAAGAVDILTFVSFGGTPLYLAAQKTFS